MLALLASSLEGPMGNIRNPIPHLLYDTKGSTRLVTSFNTECGVGLGPCPKIVRGFLAPFTMGELRTDHRATRRVM